MRENIGLYRGKRIDNDEWIEGCLVKKIDPMLGVEYCHILAQEYDTSCIDGQPTHLKSFMTWYKVDPETVGECLGMLDKNGKKIFEGDILALNKWKPYYIVKFEDGTFCMVGTAIPIRHANKFEIIGNIYDNPELVKGAADE